MTRHFVEQPRSDRPDVHHVEVGLDDRRIVQGKRLDRLHRCFCRNTPSANFAIGDQPHDRLLQLVRSQGLARRIVQLKQIHVIRTKAGQASFDRRGDCVCREIRRPVPGFVAGLGGQDDLLPRLAEGTPDQLFAMAVAVGCRGIEKRDSAFQGRCEGCQRCAIVGVAVRGFADGTAADSPGAEPDL